MRYLCLIYLDEKAHAAMAEDQMGAMMEAYGKFTEELEQAGAMLGGEALQPTETATTVQLRDGKTLTTDGRGFFILIALVVHGAASAPGVLGGPVGTFLADPRRLSLMVASFLISLILLLAIFQVLDRATPDIPFTNVENNPEAVGVYVFGYLVAFGLILNAAMKAPL